MQVVLDVCIGRLPSNLDVSIAEIEPLKVVMFPCEVLAKYIDDSEKDDPDVWGTPLTVANTE